ncbi:MAG: DUF481 domain-containing protein [Puniceicoccales bacterium]|jgi:hypothetical protein|nr:DUF481 domain-containing protein [Puniceicoccales bacterium]
MKNHFPLRLIACLALAPFITNAVAQTGAPNAPAPTETSTATAPVAIGDEAPSNPSSEALSYVLPMFQGIRMITPIKVGMAYRTPSDLNVANEHMRSLTYSVELGGRVDYGDHMLYGSLDYNYVDYHFSGPVAPFSDTERLRLYARYGYSLDDKWGLFVDASGSLASERDANLGDGASGRIGVGVSYAVSHDLNLYAGVQVASRLEDTPSWMPYLGLEWKIDPRWSLNITNGIVISYDVWTDGSLRFDLGCTYQVSSYRMTDQDMGGWRRDRALEVQEVPLVLSATQEFGEMGYVRASVGGILYSKYKFRSSERKIGEFRVDPAAIFAVEAGIRF